MKANAPKRKIFDAVDMLTEESSAHEPDRGIRICGWRRGRDSNPRYP